MDGQDDQFSLKWNNFQSNLAAGFHDLLQEEDMVDVTLAAEGKFLQAHKVILSVCSPYFRDLFKANPCKHPIVILKDVGHQELGDMLDFMYRGEANVRQDDLSAFLKLADTLKVKGLAGDKTVVENVPQSQPVSPRKLLPPGTVRKKRIVETAVFESEDDTVETDYTHHPGEPKRKRKRVPSPQPKTDSISSSAVAPFAPVQPKQEITDPVEVEFLDDGASDALVEYIEKGVSKQQDVTAPDFEDSNLDLTAGDDGNSEIDTTAGGSSMLDETADQVPQGINSYYYMDNQHGLPQLVHDGYVLRRDRERSRHTLNLRGENVTRVRTYWRCIMRTCRARGNVDPSGQLRLTHGHDHERNEEHAKYRNLRAEIKKRAVENRHESPEEILAHFNINEPSLVKTIVNWRYRYTKEGNVGQDRAADTSDIRRLLVKQKVAGRDVFQIKGEVDDTITMEDEGEIVLENDEEVNLLHIAETVGEDGETKKIYYILKE